MKRLKVFFRIFLLLNLGVVYAQELTLFQQFNGHYDYVSFGNTLNIEENGALTNCEILSESSANFQLQEGQQVVAAYLYWAGSGTGDFEVSLNGIPISSEREFSYSYNSSTTEYIYFAAFSDVTSLVSSNGNGNYTIGDLDLQESIQPYCQINGGNSTNFGGWAVTVVYEDPSLPFNQVAVFDGMEAVYMGNSVLTIELNNLYVLDNTGAKIGFLAWEGDKNIANNETLTINGNIISNPPLNPADNAFNGTNSFTGSTELYNMDVDFYNIENYISPGDTEATIQLTSNQDLVMVNNITTVLNTGLADATIQIDTNLYACRQRDLNINYTVYNTNATAPLPSSTPITFYIDDIIIEQTQTLTTIPINGSESNTIEVNLPDSVPDNFEILVRVDDNGTGSGIINEINETNNEFLILVEFGTLTPIPELPNLLTCDEGFDSATFNLTGQNDLISTGSNDMITYFTTLENAIANENEISDPESYQNGNNPQTIYVRLENEICFTTSSFLIETENCVPIIPEGFSPNGDGINDEFEIYNLLNIYPEFELNIYSRYGNLIYKGYNKDGFWNGISNEGLLFDGNLAPTGVYYYVLNLKDAEYPNPIIGDIYINY